MVLEMITPPSENRIDIGKVNIFIITSLAKAKKISPKQTNR